VNRLVLSFLAFFGLIASAAAQAPVAPPPLEPANILNLQLSTGGVVRIQLRPDKAPGHVERVKLLARAGFYDGLLFHRVIEGFMAQTGDPKGDGSGGSPLPDLKAEFNDLPHVRGAISAARTSDPDTANSQFFICFAPVVRLDGKYTVFGRVIGGMQFVDAIERGEPPAAPSKIVRAWIEVDGPDAPRVALSVPAKAEPQTP
jgi:cyclophilin family peptidyl-prolyl cis-trans isomerase